MSPPPREQERACRCVYARQRPVRVRSPEVRRRSGAPSSQDVDDRDAADDLRAARGVAVRADDHGIPLSPRVWAQGWALVLAEARGEGRRAGRRRRRRWSSAKAREGLRAGGSPAARPSPAAVTGQARSRPSSARRPRWSGPLAGRSSRRCRRSIATARCGRARRDMPGARGWRTRRPRRGRRAGPGAFKSPRCRRGGSARAGG